MTTRSPKLIAILTGAVILFALFAKSLALRCRTCGKRSAAPQWVFIKNMPS